MSKFSVKFFNAIPAALSYSWTKIEDRTARPVIISLVARVL